MHALNINQNINKSVQLVIDSGFSSTTIVTLLNNKPVYNSIKRIDIGGKLMTNYLKDALGNQTDLDIRKDFYTVNLLKEELCFISKDFDNDMKHSKSKGENNMLNFILPDYRGKTIDELTKLPRDRYSIKVDSLRFITPELLFNPSIIGIDQGGLQEGIAQAIKECHEDFKNLLYENIILTGGNCNISNFTERLSYELIPNSDYDSDIKIWNMSNNNYSDTVIKGMKQLSNNYESICESTISKTEYEEIGFNVFWKSCY